MPKKEAKKRKLDELALEMYQKGIRQYAIAMFYGVSKQAVDDFLFKRGVKRKRELEKGTPTTIRLYHDEADILSRLANALDEPQSEVIRRAIRTLGETHNISPTP